MGTPIRLQIAITSASKSLTQSDVSPPVSLVRFVLGGGEAGALVVPAIVSSAPITNGQIVGLTTWPGAIVDWSQILKLAVPWVTTVQPGGRLEIRNLGGVAPATVDPATIYLTLPQSVTASATVTWLGA